MAIANKRKRVLVAMSGGVDSSVTALLLQRRGYDVVGLTMRLADVPKEEARGPRSCCSVEDVADARAVADALGIAFFAGSYKEAFRRRVIDYFVESYKQGLTPNPCAKCNEHLKFDLLLERADELDCDYLATGHYARIDRSGARPKLRRGLDCDKDQSYFLFTLREEVMDRVLFPVGDLSKDEVRRIAEDSGLPVARKPDSQEICFVPDSGYVAFVESRGGAGTPGKIVDLSGKVVGEHRGLHAYTVGQRRGLNLGGGEEPFYVVRFDRARNEVVVGPAEALGSPSVRVRLASLASELPATFRAAVQIRYRHAPAPARIERLEGERALIVFDDPQRAPTPGQAAVLYDGDRVLGGGWIEEVTRA